VNTSIRVLIADDHTIFRDGMAALLQAASGYEVVGEAGSGAEAVEKAAALSPDVILMDVVMPDLNGVVATQRILSQNPAIGVIMLTMLEDDESLFAAMCAGARGYILKGSGKAEVLHTIQVVASGAAMFGPAIAGRLAHFFREGPSAGEGPFPELTQREREVLDLIASGESNQAIASQLHISSKTVGNHISNIFNKLQVADRAQAIVKAREAGLGNRYGE
jgi:DNA-binding NarL/FixJ family response regulator